MSLPPVSLPRSSTRTIRHAGADYHLLVAWPAHPPPAAGYPVVYLLDAHVAFATAVESERGRSHREDATGVPPTVIAGLTLAGHPVDRQRRTRDFTRAGLVLPESEQRAGVPTPSTGGAEATTELLMSVVIPTVEGEHRIDPARRLLLGHSLSGLFVLETLFAQPSLFRAFVAASPSIWWDPEGVRTRASRLMGALGGVAPHVLLTAGEFEETLPPRLAHRPEANAILAQRQRRQMVAHVRSLADQLAAPFSSRGGSARTVIFAGEDHASVVPLTINEALRIW